MAFAILSRHRSSSPPPHWGQAPGSLADVEVAEVLKRPEVAKILILLILRGIMPQRIFRIDSGQTRVLLS